MVHDNCMVQFESGRLVTERPQVQVALEALEEY